MCRITCATSYRDRPRMKDKLIAVVALIIQNDEIKHFNVVVFSVMFRIRFSINHELLAKNVHQFDIVSSLQTKK